MRDLISRQAAIDAADYTDYTGLAIEDVKKVTDEVVKELKKLPSVDAVPVVRCKDCKIRYTDHCGMFDVDSEWEWTDDNGFCQYGERKE